MSYETDKCPLETGRRRFVKGVVAGAALVGLGVSGASAVNRATNPTGRGGGILQYVGIPVVAAWLDAASDQYFITWLNKRTHFRCVPAFNGTEQSGRFDAENRVYCPCHQSVYDPFRPVQQSFVALPRPTE